MDKERVEIKQMYYYYLASSSHSNCNRAEKHSLASFNPRSLLIIFLQQMQESQRTYFVVFPIGPLVCSLRRYEEVTFLVSSTVRADMRCFPYYGV